MVTLLRAALRFVLITGVTLLIALALFTGLLRLGLPYASTYKNEIQSWVSGYLGAPVEIGTMELGWDAVRPHITLDDVALTSDPARGVKVTLQQIDLDFNLFKSLFSGAMHINDVTIVGANLSLEYFGNSEFKVSSPFSEDETSTNDSRSSGLDLPAWLFNARRVGLVNSRVKLLDRKRGIDYQINNLNIRAENDANFHQLRVDLQLPGQLGKTLEIGVDLSGSSDALEESEGRFYANATDLEVQNWMDIWPERLVSVGGISDVEIWGEWSGQRLQNLRGRLDGNHVEMVAGTDKEKIDDTRIALVTAGAANYPSIETDFTWRRRPDGWRLEVDKLNFNHGGRFNEIKGALITRTDSDAEKNVRMTGQGELLDIGALSRLVATFEHIPLLAPVARYASGAMMQGDIEQWQLDALIHDDAAPVIDLNAKLDNFAMNSYQRFPGIKRLSGAVELVGNRGQIELDSHNLVVQHRRVFPKPLSLDRVRGVFDIDLNAGDVNSADVNPDVVNPDNEILSTNRLEITDADFQSTSSLRLFRDQDVLGYEFDGVYELDNIATAKRYLPLGVMRPRLVEWLTLALQSGELSDGRVSLRGTTDELPWLSDRGHFSAAFALQDTSIKFRPDWPALTGASGQVEFSGLSMTLASKTGELAGTDISRIDGKIDNFLLPVLHIDGDVTGPLQALLDFANDGPLKSTLNPVLDQTYGSGDVKLGVVTEIPLRPLKFRTPAEKFSVSGDITLNRNRLNFNRFEVDLRRVVGNIGFTETGINFDTINARFLDTAVTLHAETDREGTGRRTDIRMSGLFHADRVLTHYNIPIAEFVEGPALWRVQLQVPHPELGQRSRPARLTTWSDLIGSAINLPVPLAKGAGSARAFSASTRIGNSATLQWDVRYDTLMQARIHTKEDNSLQAMSVALGDVELQDELETGIRVDGKVNALAFDGWIETINQIIDSVEGTETPRKIQPVYADLQTKELIVGTRLTGPAKLRVNTDTNNINASLTSNHLRGNIRFPREHWIESKPVRTRIAYVDQAFILALASQEGEGDETPIDPIGLPRIETHVAELKWDSFIFRNIGLRTEPTAAGLAITALGFANDSSQLVGEGVWRHKDPQGLNPALSGQQTSRLDLKFQSDNLGKAISAMGYSDAMAEGRGAVSLALSWSGAVYKPDLASLSGKLAIRFKDGRLLRVEPGAAKLIGLFALQEIPRRLSLDFRDVVKDGLDYGEINGDITINNGIMITHLLQLDGPIGVLDVTGVSDLQNRTLDQKIQVLPRVSAALPILALLSGGATAGIGALLATPILKKLGIDFDRIGLTEYSLTGSWNDPVIERLAAPALPDTSQSRD